MATHDVCLNCRLVWLRDENPLGLAVWNNDPRRRSSLVRDATVARENRSFGLYRRLTFHRSRESRRHSGRLWCFGPTLGAGTASSASIKPSAAAAGQTERVIPLPEEELKIGKRATEQVHRVKTYVVEEPVRENVQLHNERVTIEKRPATSANSGQPVEREYEVREHHGEPVVEKQTRAGEEVVIRKEADDRTERISDTVRKTKVDIGSTAKRR